LWYLPGHVRIRGVVSQKKLVGKKFGKLAVGKSIEVVCEYSIEGVGLQNGVHAVRPCNFGALCSEKPHSTCHRGINRLAWRRREPGDFRDMPSLSGLKPGRLLDRKKTKWMKRRAP
jgi:hypothetical protein